MRRCALLLLTVNAFVLAFNPALAVLSQPPKAEPTSKIQKKSGPPATTVDAQNKPQDKGQPSPKGVENGPQGNPANATTCKVAPKVVSTTSTASLGGRITVSISSLKDWVEERKDCCKGKDDCRQLRLFLAGNILRNLEPINVDSKNESATFILRPDTGDKKDRQSWFNILEEARRRKEKEEGISISVGSLDDLQAFDSNEHIHLEVYPGYTGFVVLFLVALLIALIFLGYNSSLLRDGPIVAGVKPPFSLGRTQMAWWFYLVVAAYLYLWMVTGQVNMLTTSVLALIGISAGTGLSAIFIDQQKQSSDVNQRARLAIQQAALQERIAQLRAARPVPGSALDIELQTKLTELTVVNFSIAGLPVPPPKAVSRGLIDILRDGDGISFSRFQIVVWTIVFGGVFVRAVLKDLIMPDFDTTLLGLMGLSSGTYVGFKFPETSK